MNAFARLRLFPNPATNLLQLETSQKGKFTVFIQDVSQRVVKKLELFSTNGPLTTAIDISNLPKGAYFIRVADKQISFSKQ